MMERRRENTVVKQMEFPSIGVWAVEQVTVGATNHPTFIASSLQFAVCELASGKRGLL
jgi:hypothetical protein